MGHAAHVRCLLGPERAATGRLRGDGAAASLHPFGRSRLSQSCQYYYRHRNATCVHARHHHAAIGALRRTASGQVLQHSHAEVTTSCSAGLHVRCMCHASCCWP